VRALPGLLIRHFEFHPLLRP